MYDLFRNDPLDKRCAPRILALLGVLSALLTGPVPHASPDAVVVFNEIQYNPAGQSEEGEWIGGNSWRVVWRAAPTGALRSFVRLRVRSKE